MAGSAALAKKSGYCYIYITNESNDLVYFDNFTLAHERSSLMEETHYYPFGLIMAGISSKAAGKLENKFKFNEGTELENKEFSDGSGLELYSTDFRSYDAQVGRFHQMDPLGELFDNESLYVYAGNNPMRYNDPFGLTKTTTDTTSTLPPVEVVAQRRTPNPNVSPTSPSVNSAGAEPLPANPNPSPLRPVGPPGKVLPLNPIIKPSAPPGLGYLGLSLRFLGTVGGLLYPTPTGLGASSVPKVFPDPFKGHGNRDDNSNPHIVYRFSFIPPNGDVRTPILKYGISDEYKNGFERPENQVAGLQLLYGKTVSWTLLARTVNRAEAKLLESLFVDQHIKFWHERPRAQIRP
jgi:RHS repeat-associated protein